MGKPEDDLKYSREIFTQICEYISDDMSLKQALELAEGPFGEKVSRATFYNWLDRQDEDYSWRLELYARAKSDSADSGFDEIRRLSELVEKKQLDPNSARVIIDAHKWRLSKLKPKVYGEKIDVNHDGGLNITVVGVGSQDTSKGDTGASTKPGKPKRKQTGHAKK